MKLEVKITDGKGKPVKDPVKWFKERFDEGLEKALKEQKKKKNK